MDYKQIPQPELIKGVKSWENPKNKFRVLALRYDADPDKDPERNGKEWYEKERQGMPKAKWNKEYELDFASKSGQLIFGPEYCDFNPGHHFIDSFDVEGELLFSLDFGQSNPNAGLIGCYDRNGILYIIDEYYKPAIPSVASREMFEQFAHHMDRTPEEMKEIDFDHKRDLARDYFQIMVIDPTTRAKNRVKVIDGEEAQYSIVEDFYDNGLEFDLGNNDWDASITRIREYFQIGSNGKAHLYIFADKCPNLCWELQKYKYKEQTETQSRQNNESERPVKKHDHAIDSLRYMIMTKPLRPSDAAPVLTTIQKDIQRILKPVNLSATWDIDQ